MRLNNQSQVYVGQWGLAPDSCSIQCKSSEMSR